MAEQTLTDAELVILSLIYEQPQHGYQLEGQITQRNMRAWTDLSTSSIYYLLGKLEEKGLIIQTQEDHEEETDRPRKVYQITNEGKKIWKEATLQALSQPKFTYTNFLMGLHNLWNIPPSEALEAVQAYKDWLEGDLERQRRELDDLGVSFFPLDVLFEYGFVLGDAELSFLADLITRLEEMSLQAQIDNEFKDV
jgi:DNA-binding PadR family transcriptional regulator